MSKILPTLTASHRANRYHVRRRHTESLCDHFHLRGAYLLPYCKYREDLNYKHKHILPVYLPTSYPPLAPFLHVGSGSALSHERTLEPFSPTPPGLRT
jgi:hypothetical protein